MQELWI